MGVMSKRCRSLGIGYGTIANNLAGSCICSPVGKEHDFHLGFTSHRLAQGVLVKVPNPPAVLQVANGSGTVNSTQRLVYEVSNRG